MKCLNLAFQLQKATREKKHKNAVCTTKEIFSGMSNKFIGSTRAAGSTSAAESKYSADQHVQQNQHILRINECSRINIFCG
jgi:hypothetical protein